MPFPVIEKLQGAVNDINVTFEGFPEELNDRLTCFNCGGINEKGEAFEKDVTVPTGTVLPLWIGLDIPEDMEGRPIPSMDTKGS